MTTYPAEDIAKLLSKTLLLDGVDFEKVAELGKRGTLSNAESGVTLIEEGSLVAGVHLLLRGSVEVIKRDRAQVGKLLAGSCFGEICMLGQSVAATATLIASEPASILVLRKSELDDWLEGDFETQSILYRNLAGELAQKLANTTELLERALGAK